MSCNQQLNTKSNTDSDADLILVHIVQTNVCDMEILLLMRIFKYTIDEWRTER